MVSVPGRQALMDNGRNHKRKGMDWLGGIVISGVPDVWKVWHARVTSGGKKRPRTFFYTQTATPDPASIKFFEKEPD